MQSAQKHLSCVLGQAARALKHFLRAQDDAGRARRECTGGNVHHPSEIDLAFAFLIVFARVRAGTELTMLIRVQE